MHTPVADARPGWWGVQDKYVKTFIRKNPEIRMIPLKYVPVRMPAGSRVGGVRVSYRGIGFRVPACSRVGGEQQSVVTPHSRERKAGGLSCAPVDLHGWG